LRFANASSAHLHNLLNKKERTMKRLLYCSLLLLWLLAACRPIAAQAPQAQSEPASYVDPEGRFLVPVPTNWRSVEEGDYALLYSPDERIKIYFLVLKGVEAEEAAALAWAKVDPSFEAQPSMLQEAPSRSGVSRTLYYDYESSADQIRMAAVEAAGERIYVTLIRAEARAMQERAAQVDMILGGFAPEVAAQVDLRGVMPQAFGAQQVAELSAYIEDALVRFDVPGAAVAVVQGDEVILLEGFGVRERGQDDPVTAQTRFMIGSVNKTMTTMLMAQLVDKGLMAWDSPVQSIIPQFAVADPAISARMTVRNLVCACSGVPRRDLEYFFNAAEMSAERVIESLRSFDFFTAFGEAFQYSNQLVATGGWVAAAAAGGRYRELDQAYLELVEAEVFAPIGMSDSTFSFEEVAASGNYAVPHRLSTTGARVPLPVDADRLLLGIAPAGAAWSTAADMSRYLLTQMHRGVTPQGTQVVSAYNLAETWQPQVPVNGTTSYGLGWFVDTYKGQPLLHHGGNTSGFSSDLAFLPEAELGIVVLSNGRLANAFTQAVRFRLWELAFAQAHEFDARAAFENTQTVQLSLAPLDGATAVDAVLVAPYLGRYTNPDLGEIQLRFEGESLMIDSGELVMEVLAAPDQNGAAGSYVINSYIGPVLGMGVHFANDEAGNALLVLVKASDRYPFTRLP
jgi:CubicO group peptidase (beta-lactamase class C family)